MVADKIDQSLDDIIATNKKGRGRGRGGRGGRGARGRSSSNRGGNRGSRGGNRGSGPVRRGRGENYRNEPYSRSRNMSDKWEHDMYDGTGRGASTARSASTRGLRSEGLSTGSHLQISNLDFGVTESDIKELFSEFGKLKKAIINYDSSGRSHGTADVVYERKADALKAFQTYNGVPLDGRAMKIEQVSPQVVSNTAGRQERRESSGGYGGNSYRSNRGNRGSNRSGNRGSGSSRGSSRGGRGARGGGRGGGRGRGRPAPPSKDDLDEELDSYIESAN